jgi:arabinofuranosyltransferase
MHGQENKFFNQMVKILCLVFCLGLYIYIYLVKAWMFDDAYITFRTVENLINGYGLTWNPGERVQTFTHPLWMLLITFFYFFTTEFYYTTIAISFVLCLSAVLIFYSFLHKETLWKPCIFVLLLVSSKAFIDFSSSGLENPLSFFLLSIFYVLILSHSNRLTDFTAKEIFYLFFVASLIFINRVDLILLCIPALLFISIVMMRKNGLIFIKYAGAGLLPAITWLLFSLVYYGFFLPNTAYAKLATGISSMLLLKQGIYYYLYTLFFDSITLIIIGITLFLTIYRWNTNKASLILFFGVGFYLLYILRIGGDFCGGRFFSVPFFLCSFLLISQLKHRSTGLFILFFSLLLIFLTNNSTINDSGSFLQRPFFKNISDQRAYYYPYTGLMRHIEKQNKKHNWELWGEFFKKSPKKVSEFHAIGMYGLVAGPSKYIIDDFGLADPLLSRLPVIEKTNFWIGHFQRRIPEGYVESVEYNKNLIKDPSLHEFYEIIRCITRGNIFDSKRFVYILKINTGQFQYLLNDYLNKK